jgi:predicted ribosome quality control (RQC) complex YloA/Tae2 family protein
LDLDTLVKVVDELAILLPGARVDKVVQGVDHDLFLVLHQKRKNYFLFLSPQRALPRIHLVSRKPSGTTVDAGFFLSLKKHLTGGRFDGIRLVNGDRVVEFQFTTRGTVHALIFELIGVSANIILADQQQTILAVFRPVPPGDRVRRPFLPGLSYEPPVPRPGASTAKGRIAPIFHPEEYSGTAPLNRAVEIWYERIIAEQETSALRQELASVVSKAAGKVVRRRDAVARDVAGAEQGDTFRQMGELVLANKHLLTKGQLTAELTGYDGTTVSVALDPSRFPAENASKYFQRYKKAKAGIAVMRERFAEARDEAEFLKSVQEDLKAANDRDELLAIRSLLARRGYVKKGTGKVSGTRSLSSPPFRTVWYEGWEILVGKSSAGNDYITMKIARPDDLWLHAEGMPGSHVVVKNPGKRDIPDGVLKKAASLAAYYSKGKNSAKVPVTYTRAAFVKKPKGAAPGSVVLTARKTIMAAPKPDQN